tara:strand:+ start:648 stop:965 length:318 start_codon:yes stop_codon:yes gene_type:complete
MKLYRLFLLLNIILFLASCGSVKEGFSSQKKNNSDEFLVEKKSPLIMPPDYNELPVPKEENSVKETDENEIKSLILKTKNDEIVENVEEKDKTFEELLLKKIKKN